MKRVALCLLAAVLFCCGCAQTQEDPFRVDTVILIPADPTDAPTEEATEMPTQAPTEVPATVNEEGPKETTAPAVASYKSTGSGTKSTYSGKSQSSAAQKPKETQPQAAEPVLPPALAPEEAPYNPSTYIVGELEHALLQELNLRRLEAGLGELALNERLSGIASLRAQEASILWNHTRLNGSDYTTALTEYGFECGNSAELMIYGSGSGDPAAFAAMWMASKSQRENIYSGDYSTAGIGIYRTEEITYVVCLLIG